MENTAIGVGELAAKERSVGLNKSTQRAIHHKTRCKGTTPQKGNHNQNQTGSPDEETGQRTLSDFGVQSQRVEFVGDGTMTVLKHPERIKQIMCFCVHSCENVMSGCLDVPSSSGISDVRVIEEPADTHELKPDRTTGEMLLAVGCRDDRPNVDSGNVVKLCPRAPVDYAMSVPTEKVNYSMNLESVLGESLQHYGVKRNVPFVNRKGSTMTVNFEVTDTKRATLSVHKGCGNGAKVVFTPDGRGKVINDKRCNEHVQQIMGTTPGFDIVYDRGACVLDADVNGVQPLESDSGIAFPVIRKEYWEKTLSQAQHEHERKQDVHGQGQGSTKTLRAHERRTSIPRSHTLSFFVLGVKA